MTLASKAGVMMILISAIKIVCLLLVLLMTPSAIAASATAALVLAMSSSSVKDNDDPDLAGGAAPSPYTRVVALQARREVLVAARSRPRTFSCNSSSPDQFAPALLISNAHLMNL